jgi:hypothetical protein
MEEIDIWRAARLLIQQHGDEAEWRLRASEIWLSKEVILGVNEFGATF